MEIRSVEGCVDFDCPDPPSQQLQDGWNEEDFLRETAEVFKRIARSGRITPANLRDFMMSTKFHEERGKNRTPPHEMEAEIMATFNDLDLNNDGVITLTEFRRYHRNRFHQVIQDLRDDGQ